MNQQQPNSQPVRLLAQGGLLDGAQLSKLVEAIGEQAHYMILANSEEKQLTHFSLQEAQKPTEWTEGILFGPHLEVRWRLKKGAFAVALLQEVEMLPDLAIPNGLDAQEEAQFERIYVHVPLWGKHREGDVDEEDTPFWYEAQIPRLLYYPSQQKVDGWPSTVALQVAQYYSQHQLMFNRFVNLEEWPHD